MMKIFGIRFSTLLSFFLMKKNRSNATTVEGGVQSTTMDVLFAISVLQYREIEIQ